MNLQESGAQYYSQTLELLDEGWATTHSLQPLREWASQHDVDFESIPLAYRAWCRFDGAGERLHKFSNMDKFFLMAPRLAELDDGTPLLCFKSENQDNYRLAVPLCSPGGDADPPVYFSWVSGPWKAYCDSFSQYVFTQVFDYQHPMAADPFVGYVMLRYDPSAIAVLDRSLQRGPTTHFEIDGVDYVEHRFFRKPSQRIKATLVAEQSVIELFVTSDDRRQGELFRDAWAERLRRYGAE